MQLQDLEIFEQLYALRSINLTAKTLNFAQSNITARLRVLEREFATTLFTRSYQGITPTASGELFHNYARNTLATTAKLRTDIHQVTPKRRVRISELLFNYLVVLQAKFDLQQMDFEITNSSLMLQTKATDADMVITYANFKSDDFRETNLDYLPAGFLASADVPSATLPILINSDHHCPFRQRTLRYLKNDRSRVVEVDSWSNIIDLVKSGRGTALLPLYVGEREQLQAILPTHQYRIPYKTFVNQAN
jgi:DNA-binding transcriptional LysR family regulator